MPPQMDGPALRARLAPAMAAPGRPMPRDAADLDAMSLQPSAEPLLARLRRTTTPQDILLDMNWEQIQLYDGAGYGIAIAYMFDLWRIGSILPPAQGDPTKQTAAMMFVYAFELIALDGLKCADPTAPEHRRDQLFTQNRGIVAYMSGLPLNTRMTLGTISLSIELATAPLRQNDTVLCSAGLVQMSEGLKAQGDKPLPQVPTPPGMLGTTYAVPPPPGFVPGFVAADVWGPRQVEVRRQLPATLTRLLFDNAPDRPTPPTK